MSGLISCPRPLTKVGAFQELGYEYQSARGVWSAERGDRVLVTIWDQEVRRLNGHGIYLDADELHPAGSPWREQAPRHPKHLKVAQRLKRMIGQNDLLDVVVLFGPVGSPRFATTWRADEQDDLKWRVISVKDENGFFRIEAVNH
jgi:hypothetical protein